MRKDGNYNKVRAGNEKLETRQNKYEESVAGDDAYYDALLKKRIGEALRTEDGGEKLDIETLRSWVAEDNRKKMQRRKRIFAAAAAVLLVFSTGIGISLLSGAEDYQAIAGKNDPIVNDDGTDVVIKDNQEDVEENIGADEVVVDDWEHVATVKKEYPDLLIPEYVPDGYEFEQLRIEAIGIVERYMFLFKYGDNTLYLIQTIGGNTTAITNYSYSISTNDGQEILVRDDVEKSAVFMISDSNLLLINGKLKDSDYKAIIENVKR